MPMRFLFVLMLLCAPALAEVKVIDGDTFDHGGERYRVNGIDAPEAGQKCKTAKGKSWACGKAARDYLFELLHGADVRCEHLVRDDYGRMIANCAVNGQDLGHQMVRQGLAWAYVKFSDVYVLPQKRAKSERLGIWQGDARPAWEFRADRWKVARQEAPEGCPIKGNISKNGKIYHTPWSRYYTRTFITESKGERWFCDEAEALDAGWRAPYWN